MMFREKGNKVVCLRSQYLTEKKRTHAVQIASFDKWLSTAPNEVCQLLDSEEIEQLNKWLSEREEKKAVDSHINSMTYIAGSLGRLTEALADERAVSAVYHSEHDKNHPRNGEPLFDQAWADRLFDAIADARKALKKAGFKPSPKEPVNKAVDGVNNEAVNVPVDGSYNVPVDGSYNEAVVSNDDVPVDGYDYVPVVSNDNVPVDDYDDRAVDNTGSEAVFDGGGWSNNSGG